MSQFYYPAELDPERMRKLANVQREAAVKDWRTQRNMQQQDAYRAWSPIRSKNGREIFRFRETNPQGTPLPAELMARRDEANEGLSQGMTPTMLQDTRLAQQQAGANVRLTDANAGAATTNSQANLASGRGDQIRAVTAPLADLLVAKTRAGADQNIAQTQLQGVNRQAVADENVARTRVRGDIGAARSQAEAARYGADREFATADMISQRKLQGDIARASAGNGATGTANLQAKAGQAPAAIMQPPAQPQSRASVVPPEAIDMLKQDPSEDAISEFDEMFGAGAARRILGM